MTLITCSLCKLFSCPAANNVSVILELQTAATEAQTAVTRAWCRVGVFNEAGWINDGCWRLPLALPPVDLLPSAPASFTQRVNKGHFQPLPLSRLLSTTTTTTTTRQRRLRLLPLRPDHDYDYYYFHFFV